LSKNAIPDDIHNILGFVIDGRPMSTVEYDKLIKYFAKRRENALREEYGDNIPPSLANPPLGPPVDPKVKAAQVRKLFIETRQLHFGLFFCERVTKQKSF